MDKCSTYLEKDQEIWVVNEDGELSEEKYWKISKEISDKESKLSRALNKSSCTCSICGIEESDMVYIPRFEEWFCVDCAEENEWTKEPELRTKLNMSQLNIDYFLNRLKKRGLLKHDNRYFWMNPRRWEYWASTRRTLPSCAGFKGTIATARS